MKKLEKKAASVAPVKPSRIERVKPNNRDNSDEEFLKDWRGIAANTKHAPFYTLGQTFVIGVDDLKRLLLLAEKGVKKK